MSDLREALGTSRKYAVPLATLLDGRGVTRRRDDLRIAGPRLPEVEPEADRRPSPRSAAG